MSNESLTGCTSANFHEAGRSEYLAHYVFSSFGTSVPVPRQEDTGLDLHCTLGERQGQRLWPTASYSVQVKSDSKPWVFADARSIQWLVKHPLPIFLCIVNKKSLTISVYHTTPRFLIWAKGGSPERLEMVPGKRGDGFGNPWEDAIDGDTFSLSAPIAEFTIAEILNSGFHLQIQKVLTNWIVNDRGNLLRIQAGMPQFKTIAEYQTNDPVVKRWEMRWRDELGQDELDKFMETFVEQLRLLGMVYAKKEEMKRFLRVQLLLRYLDALSADVDSFYGINLLLQLKHEFPSTNASTDQEEPNGNSDSIFSGLDGLNSKIDEITRQAVIDAAECWKLEQSRHQAEQG